MDEIRDIWRPGAGLAGTRDSGAQIRDIPGNPGRVATLVMVRVWVRVRVSMIRDKVRVRVYVLRFTFYALYPQPCLCAMLVDLTIIYSL